MSPRRLGAVALVALLFLSGADGAEPEKPPYDLFLPGSTSFASLKLGIATRVNDLRADGTNRLRP